MTGTDRQRWLTLTKEEAVDSNRQIVDAHHHVHPGDNSYLASEWIADARASHNVTHSVFVETMACWRADGPQHLRPVGETEFVAAQALETELSGVTLAAIVPFADLRLGDQLDEVLDAHETAGAGRFRGIRHPTAWDINPGVPPGYMDPGPRLMADESFRRGFARLGERGFSFDAWIYHPQLVELAELARSAEGTTVILDHLGVPLNVGPYRRDEVRPQWRDGLRQLVACPNAVIKIGGVGMDTYLFQLGWSTQDRPPDSDQVVRDWGDDIRWCIDTFGPSRCMFESNYPVDRDAVGYTVLWNAFQKIAAGYTDAEQHELFAGTAARIYQIDLAK